MEYIKVSYSHSGHEWDKTNLVTLSGGFDSFQCKHCGLAGKSKIPFNHVEVKKTIKNSKKVVCPEAVLVWPKKIEITRKDSIVGEIFKNITPNSIHEVIAPPDSYTNDLKGVWVMGNGEPVKVLRAEYKVLE
jgi:hypothetical protein